MGQMEFKITENHHQYAGVSSVHLKLDLSVSTSHLFFQLNAKAKTVFRGQIPS